MLGYVFLAGVEDRTFHRITDRLAESRINIQRRTAARNICDQLHRELPGVVVLGAQNGSIDELLSQVRKIRSDGASPAIFMIARHSSEGDAIEAFRAGVNDYFIEPVQYERLCQGIMRSLAGTAGNVQGPSQTAGPAARALGMVAESDAMRSVTAYLNRAARTNSTILITGETGTGKELAAAFAHQCSPRCKGPFVCVNCAAIPDSLLESELFGYRKGAFTGALNTKKGRFELAGGGTLFLDEIGDMSLFSQAKILRALEEKTIYPLGSHAGVTIDIRVIAATNHEPESLVDQGKFRKDLYYRLNVARVHLPPLRERKEDIPHLALKTIRELEREYQTGVQALSREVLRSFFHYPWPGNVRELNNIVEAACINSSTREIRFSDLPPSFTKRLQYAGESQLDTRDRLLLTLASTNGNKSEAAKKLKWSRMRVYRTLKRYRIPMDR